MVEFLKLLKMFLKQSNYFYCTLDIKAGLIIATIINLTMLVTQAWAAVSSLTGLTPAMVIAILLVSVLYWKTRILFNSIWISSINITALLLWSGTLLITNPFALLPLFISGLLVLLISLFTHSYNNTYVFPNLSLVTALFALICYTFSFSYFNLLFHFSLSFIANWLSIWYTGNKMNRQLLYIFTTIFFGVWVVFFVKWWFEIHIPLLHNYDFALLYILFSLSSLCFKDFLVYLDSNIKFTCNNNFGQFFDLAVDCDYHQTEYKPVVEDVPNKEVLKQTYFPMRIHSEAGGGLFSNNARTKSYPKIIFGRSPGLFDNRETWSLTSSSMFKQISARVIASHAKNSFILNCFWQFSRAIHFI